MSPLSEYFLYSAIGIEAIGSVLPLDLLCL